MFFRENIRENENWVTGGTPIKMEIWKPPFSNKILLNFSEWTRCPTGKKWTIQENGGEINLIRLGVVSPSSLEKHRECGKHTPPRNDTLVLPVDSNEEKRVI